MTINRVIITTGTLLVVGMSAVASAIANPLLSGYGGPGQGSQAILGSALLNGPPGAGDGGGGSADAGLPSGEAGSAGGSQGGASGDAASSSDSGAGAKGRGKPGEDSPAYLASSRLASSEASVGSQTLGLSGEDVLWVLLALGLLAVTAVITRQLARRDR